MTEVRWTPQAADDLQAIYDFIGRDSPHYAQVIVENILAAIDRLERFPLTGRHVPERPREDLRELIKPPYRIVSLHQGLTNYAIQHAGTIADLDPDLEAAASDQLRQQDSEQ